jgi:hypothetical protein
MLAHVREQFWSTPVGKDLQQFVADSVVYTEETNGNGNDGAVNGQTGNPGQTQAGTLSPGSPGRSPGSSPGSPNGSSQSQMLQNRLHWLSNKDFYGGGSQGGGGQGGNSVT